MTYQPDEEFECGQHPFRRLLLEMLGRVVSGHLNHDLLVPFLESLLKDLSGGESKRDRFFEVLCDAFSVAFTTVSRRVVVWYGREGVSPVAHQEKGMPGGGFRKD